MSRQQSPITNINMLQALVRPEQFTAIVDWNKSRNGLELSEGLEYDMLQEEMREYFDATTLVDKLDAVADTLFVGVGSVAKGAYNLLPIVSFTEEFDIILSDFAGRCQAEDIDLQFVGQLISEGLDIVIKANAQKLAEKEVNGKVKKPEGFVPPEEALGALIKEAKIKEVPQSPMGALPPGMGPQ